MRNDRQLETEPLGFHKRDCGDQLYFLRLNDVIERTKYDHSTIYKLMNREVDPFPRPYRLSPNRVAWLESDVNAWLRARVAEGPAVPHGNLANATRKRRKSHVA